MAYPESIEIREEKLRRLALAAGDLLEAMAGALRQIEEAVYEFHEAVDQLG